MCADRSEGVLTFTLHLSGWIMALETSGDHGGLGRSQIDPPVEGSWLQGPPGCEDGSKRLAQRRAPTDPRVS